MARTTAIRIGTRASALARWQANWVANELLKLGHHANLVPITTAGDHQVESPLKDIGGTGVFTKELQRVLLDGAIDVAVHSLKDLPTEPVPGLVLAAVPPRESVCDALISRRGETLDNLPRGAIVATGSLRRRSQLLHARTDLEMADIRGNIDTRLRKLDDGIFDVLVLAEAGLKRLGLSERITQLLPTEVMLPAPGQGALGLETRADDSLTIAAVAPLSDFPAQSGVEAERSLLAALRGGCLAPVGAWGRIVQSGRLALDAVVLSPDGARRLHAAGEARGDEAPSLGRSVAEQLLKKGAAELIAACRWR